MNRARRWMRRPSRVRAAGTAGPPPGVPRAALRPPGPDATRTVRGTRRMFTGADGLAAAPVAREDAAPAARDEVGGRGSLVPAGRCRVSTSPRGPRSVGGGGA
ncbi:hypothetical protein [Thermomonospora umbrina]|nr:hypothetical protein [Thermomonospora umbrina]